MAKYGRFDPRNKKKDRHKTQSKGETFKKPGKETNLSPRQMLQMFDVGESYEMTPKYK
jgi:hypothetical protein